MTANASSDLGDLRARPHRLSVEARRSLIETLPGPVAQRLLWDWELVGAREKQLRPAGHSWQTWLILAGRGWG